jgi:hypothetical protein
VTTFSLERSKGDADKYCRNRMPFGVNELGDNSSIINSDGARSESNVKLTGV